MSDVWLEVIDLHNVKHLKKYKQIMSVTWHPTRWWDWCLPKDEKKGIEPTFTDKN